MSASTSSQCLRNHHDRCFVPATCDCACHADEAAAEVGIVWGDPPKMNRKSRGTPILGPEGEALLRAHPKRWALVREYSKPTSSNSALTRIRAGKTHLDPAEWEGTSRRLDNGGSALWLRFVGRP